MTAREQQKRSGQARDTASKRSGPADTAGRPEPALLRLQRSMGNQAVVRMLAPPAPGGLQVGAAADRHEAEADRAAAGAVAEIERQSGPLSARRRVPAAPDVTGAVVGPEGGPVDTDVEQGIRSARGGGSPLGASVRRQMEGALGAELGDVRLHSGRQADQLNGRLGAEAFTVGRDIFFSGGLPDTSTREGAGLLAHELTHTVQQSGGASRSAAQRTLKFQNTKWSSVKSAKLSGSGGGGAAFLTDNAGPPLVVKAEPGGANEAVLNAALLEEILADAEYSGWSAATPKARLLSPTEVNEILQKVNAPSGEKRGGFFGLGKKKKIGGFDPPTDDLDQRRQDTFKANLRRPGSAIVFANAKGASYDDKVDESQPIEDDQINFEHPLVRLVTDEGQMRLFGRIAAADMAIGNDDRIVGKWNSDNMLVRWGKKGGAKISLIDNVSDKALLGGAGFAPKDAFSRWAAGIEVGMASTGDINGLARFLLNDVIDPAISGGALGIKLSNDNSRWIRKQLSDNFDGLVARLELGLRDGLAASLKALSSPGRFLSGIPEDERADAMISLKARHLFLSGKEADASSAWIKAAKSVGVRWG